MTNIVLSPHALHAMPNIIDDSLGLSASQMKFYACVHVCMLNKQTNKQTNKISVFTPHRMIVFLGFYTH